MTPFIFSGLRHREYSECFCFCFYCRSDYSFVRLISAGWCEGIFRFRPRGREANANFALISNHVSGATVCGHRVDWKTGAGSLSLSLWILQKLRYVLPIKLTLTVFEFIPSITINEFRNVFERHTILNIHYSLLLQVSISSMRFNYILMIGFASFIRFSFCSWDYFRAVFPDTY